MATCADCGVHHQVPDGDLLAAAYRCPTCQYAVELAASKRRAKHGLGLIAAGVGLFAIAAVMWFAKMDLEWTDRDDFGGKHRDGLFIYVAFAAIACVAIGISLQRKRSRKLRD